MNMGIAWDKDESTEMSPRYFVYDKLGVVIYKGTYVQCLCLYGGLLLDPTTTIKDINNKTNGFLNSVPVEV